MRKYAVLLMLPVLWLLLTGCAFAADLFPPPSQYFYGTVAVEADGTESPAPPGTVVMVKQKGQDRLLAIYALWRTGTIGNVRSKGRCLTVSNRALNNGDILEFYVNGRRTATEAVFRRGVMAEINIGANYRQETVLTEVEPLQQEEEKVQRQPEPIGAEAGGAKRENDAGEQVIPSTVEEQTVPQALEEQTTTDAAGEKAGLDVAAPDSSVTEGAAGSDRLNEQQPAKDEARPEEQAEPAVTFADIKGHPLQQEIEQAAASGLVAGVTETEFEPDRPVTRAEFIVMLVKALDIKGKETQFTFMDVYSTDWFYPALKKAYSTGIIKGYNSVEFKPEEAINRQQAAAIAAKALQLLNKAPLVDRQILKKYKDAGELEPYANAGMAISLQLNLLEPINNKLMPRDKVTRAQAAAMLVRIK
ncbi:S-layer homology domain-containing protein [Metallumcola ferriviriculae]|uniref:S-layer homology domain-containing protein n=1 Tax=Metallumcola ferriviriculae TaxID=3039180 RepID=A0AAU0UJY0_9FIRM|nr:S-layer homology domain-containing protein [Desulfitibacteraceae bacterium MK1]